MQTTEAKREGEPPDDSSIKAQELLDLIRKLRWMGLDDEAEIICAQLAHLSKDAIVPLNPGGTD